MADLESPPNGTKRQRRPSVRLGPIGEEMPPAKKHVEKQNRNPTPQKIPKRPRKTPKVVEEEKQDLGCRSESDDQVREDSLSPGHINQFSDEEGQNGNSLIGGVHMWLNKLGLGRYANVFEIHEVDDEVLPFLTLDDLKDMGINAVGSRRKIFCAIQKLNNHENL